MNQKALALYTQGLAEKDTLGRNRAFNSSIEALLEGEPSDALMAANLVQLRQYPLSVYYYMKEYKKNPYDEGIVNSLAETVRIGNLPTQIPSPTLFGPPSWMSALAFFLWFLTLSLWIHFRKKGLLLLSFPLLATFLTLIVLSYRSPILGVILHAQILFQSSSGKETVSPTPIPAGLIVTVLDVQQHGSWIKVLTNDGVMGYVPEDALRIVN